MSKKICTYCGKYIESYKTFCDSDCNSKYDVFERYTNRIKPIFIISMVILLALNLIGLTLIGSGKLLGLVLIRISFICMFLIVMIIPVATPGLGKWLGIRKTALVVRIIAIMLFVSSIIEIIQNRYFN